MLDPTPGLTPPEIHPMSRPTGTTWEGDCSPLIWIFRWNIEYPKGWRLCTSLSFIAVLILSLGKAVLHTVFPPALGPWEWPLCLEPFLTKSQRVFIACAKLLTLCGNVFPCYTLNVYPSVLLKHVVTWCLTISTAVSVPFGEKMGNFSCTSRVYWLLGRLTDREEQCLLLEAILPHLFPI
jgi:hypothetical protein